MTRRALIAIPCGKGRTLHLLVHPFYWLFGSWEGPFTKTFGFGPVFYWTKRKPYASGRIPC